LDEFEVREDAHSVRAFRNFAWKQSRTGRCRAGFLLERARAAEKRHHIGRLAKFGARFSKKAATASFSSGEPNRARNTAPSWAIRSATVFGALRNNALVCRTASGGRAATARARERVVSYSWGSATTRLTMPYR